jgi:DNA-binding NtrC family response regulator
MARILIVDDQACIRKFLSEELIDEGYAVQTAPDAKSVRGYLKFSPPDLILLDLYLDGSDGIFLLHEIKGQYPGLPVIIFTAYDSYRDDPRISAKADGCIIKSIFLGKLKREIAHHIGCEGAPRRIVAGTQPSSKGAAQATGSRSKRTAAA